jgi:4a-hydroxytetrahydrobiopterin dehydratase
LKDWEAGSADLPLVLPGEAFYIHFMDQPLPSAEIAAALSGLPGWSLAGDALAKEYKFGSFREAMSFMIRVSYEADAMDHHPDWTNVYNRVTIRLNTHSAGGKVTAKDVTLAQKIQKISWAG